MTILTPFIFAIAYALKGGQLGHIIPHVVTLRQRNKVFERLFDGKVISTLFLFIALNAITVLYQVNLGALPLAWQSNVAILVAWLLAVSPSMGEEYAAIANTKTNNPYKDHFGRMYGIKKGIQRGVWMGAIMALATGSLAFIWASFLFVPLAWVALHYAPNKGLDPWGWSEVLIGAVCFGLPFYLMGM